MLSTLLRWKNEVASIPTKKGKILIAEEIDVKLLENAKWHKAYENQVNIKNLERALDRKRKK